MQERLCAGCEGRREGQQKLGGLCFVMKGGVLAQAASTEHCIDRVP